MKKYLAAVVSVSALVATSAVAFAADLPTRKEAAIAPVPQLWTGAYAGLNVGGGFSTSNTVQTIGYSTFDWAASTLGMPFGFSAPYRSGYASVGQSGVIGGGQVGYNYQINPNILIGFEADFQGSGISGSGTSYGLGGAIDASDKTHLQNGLVSTTAGIGWMGTARARVGYLVKPTLLLFGTGGFAYGDTWANVNSIGLHSHPRGEAPDLVMPTSGSFNNVSVGWTAGGGAEWMFIQNWSSKVEVLY